MNKERKTVDQLIDQAKEWGDESQGERSIIQGFNPKLEYSLAYLEIANYIDLNNVSIPQFHVVAALDAIWTGNWSAVAHMLAFLYNHASCFQMVAESRKKTGVDDELKAKAREKVSGVIANIKDHVPGS